MTKPRTIDIDKATDQDLIFLAGKLGWTNSVKLTVDKNDRPVRSSNLWKVEEIKLPSKKG